MWVSRSDGSRDFANQAYLEYFGVEEGDVHQHDWAATLHPSDHDRIVALFAPDGDPRAVEFPSCGEGKKDMTTNHGLPVIECPDGRELRYDESGFPLETNPPGFQDQVPTFVAVRAHDGHVLVQLP